jgi:hypothetical protein
MPWVMPWRDDAISMITEQQSTSHGMYMHHECTETTILTAGSVL